jgi:hypothetical protein
MCVHCQARIMRGGGDCSRGACVSDLLEPCQQQCTARRQRAGHKEGSWLAELKSRSYGISLSDVSCGISLCGAQLHDV